MLRARACFEEMADCDVIGIHTVESINAEMTVLSHAYEPYLCTPLQKNYAPAGKLVLRAQTVFPE